MLSFRKIGQTHADATSTYEVFFDGEHTVRTFIKEVLKDRKGDWGSICIENEKGFFGDTVCEYKYGKLLSRMKVLSRKNKKILDKKVISVKANGGYTCMSYVLKIENL